MERDIAIRLDSMAHAASTSLNGIAQYMKDNLSDEEFVERRMFIAKAMGEMLQLSMSLYAIFPDIVPKGMQPDVDNL